MLISRQQKAIIRTICRVQEESFLRILEHKIQQIKNDMEEEGYEVSESDIFEQIAIELQQWDRAKSDPVAFINLLDEKNIGMVKHHLVNSFLNSPHSKAIWAKISLYDKTNQFPN